MEYKAQPIYVQNANLNSENPEKVTLKIFKVVTLLARSSGHHVFENLIYGNWVRANSQLNIHEILFAFLLKIELAKMLT